jgi:L-asparaginase / beta-aspartyl-peptidase
MGGMPPVIAIHAGAGDRVEGLLEDEPEVRRALVQALGAGAAALERGLPASDAAQAAIVVMESCERFNAGRGSALCSDGSVEMSAALMRADRAAGAVALVRHTEHPILGAAAVLSSPQVLMVGEAADALAERAGVPQRPNSYFVSERQRQRLRQAGTRAEQATVGAVCLDRHGELAAGTSTGGIRGQPPGRVGDTPLIGAGTWADQRVAISCTGDGEAFIRSGTARWIGARVEQAVPLAEAAEGALDQIAALGAGGGLIAIDARGAVSMPFLTRAMPRGVWRAGEGATVWIP